MLSMSLTGAAAMAAGGRTSSANVLAGLLTTYLVTTALTTVSTRSVLVKKLDRGAMVAAASFGVVSVASALGILATGGESSRGGARPHTVVGKQTVFLRPSSPYLVLPTAVSVMVRDVESRNCFSVARPWRVRKLLVKRLTVPHAPAEELRPGRNCRDQTGRFRQ
jgi:hypothetical protein